MGERRENRAHPRVQDIRLYSGNLGERPRRFRGRRSVGRAAVTLPPSPFLYTHFLLLKRCQKG